MSDHREDHQDRHQTGGPDELRGNISANAATATLAARATLADRAVYTGLGLLDHSPSVDIYIPDNHGVQAVHEVSLNGVELDIRANSELAVETTDARAGLAFSEGVARSETVPGPSYTLVGTAELEVPKDRELVIGRDAIIEVGEPRGADRYGVGAPASTNCVIGDRYYDTAANRVYVCRTAGTWTALPIERQGAGFPSATGVTGDRYWDTTNGQPYAWHNGIWRLQGQGKPAAQVVKACVGATCGGGNYDYDYASTNNANTRFEIAFTKYGQASDTNVLVTFVSSLFGNSAGNVLLSMMLAPSASTTFYYGGAGVLYPIATGAFFINTITQHQLMAAQWYLISVPNGTYRCKPFWTGLCSTDYNDTVAYTVQEISA